MPCREVSFYRKLYIDMQKKTPPERRCGQAARCSALLSFAAHLAV